MLRLLLVLVAIAAAGIWLVRFLERRRRERIAQLRSAFLLEQRPPREHGPALKEVRLRNEALHLRVPEPWAEEYPDAESAAFSDRRGRRLVLRVATTTIPCPAAGLAEALRARAEEPTTLEQLAPGELLVKSLSIAGVDGGEVGFRWIRGREVADARARIACFTLVVPLASAGDPLTRDDVAQVEHEVRAARIAR